MGVKMDFSCDMETSGRPSTTDSSGGAPLRVLLINPPRFNELIGKNPAIVEKHRGFNPPLGLLQLAGYLEEHTRHHVEVLDVQPRQGPSKASVV